MSRLRSLLHVASASKRNTQQNSSGLQVQSQKSEVFSFLRPNDTESREPAEAVGQAYAANEARARQEAGWEAERELAWQTFIGNARRIIEAPLAQREILLAIYGVEATRRFGPRMGTDMMKSMASWVRLKGVH